MRGALLENIFNDPSDETRVCGTKTTLQYSTSNWTHWRLSKSNSRLLRTIMVNRLRLSITAGVTSNVPLLFSRVNAYTDSFPCSVFYIVLCTTQNAPQRHVIVLYTRQRMTTLDTRTAAELDSTQSLGRQILFLFFRSLGTL